MSTSLYRSVNFLKSRNGAIIYFIRCLHADVPKYKDSKPEAALSGGSGSGGLFKRPVRGEPGEVSAFVVLILHTCGFHLRLVNFKLK